MKVKLKPNKIEVSSGDILVDTVTNDVCMVCVDSKGRSCLVNLSSGYVYEDTYIDPIELLYEFDLEDTVIVKSENIVLEEV